MQNKQKVVSLALGLAGAFLSVHFVGKGNELSSKIGQPLFVQPTNIQNDVRNFCTQNVSPKIDSQLRSQEIELCGATQAVVNQAVTNESRIKYTFAFFAGAVGLSLLGAVGAVTVINSRGISKPALQND